MADWMQERPTTLQDSDDDGLHDGLEHDRAGLSPTNADSDEDGIIDGLEDVNHNGTDPGRATRHWPIRTATACPMVSKTPTRMDAIKRDMRISS